MILAILFALAPPAAQSDRFAYRFEMTGEADPRDPVIERRYTAAFADCQKRAVSTQQNAACLQAEFARQDSALNRVWRATFGRLPGGARGALLNAQRKCIAGRDPFCRERADGFAGGTIAPLVYVDCRIEQTIRRTIWLEHFR